MFVYSLPPCYWYFWAAGTRRCFVLLWSGTERCSLSLRSLSKTFFCLVLQEFWDSVPCWSQPEGTPLNIWTPPLFTGGYFSRQHLTRSSWCYCMEWICNLCQTFVMNTEGCFFKQPDFILWCIMCYKSHRWTVQANVRTTSKTRQSSLKSLNFLFDWENNVIYDLDFLLYSSVACKRQKSFCQPRNKTQEINTWWEFSSNIFLEIHLQNSVWMAAKLTIDLKLSFPLIVSFKLRRQHLPNITKLQTKASWTFHIHQRNCRIQFRSMSCINVVRSPHV